MVGTSRGLCGWTRTWRRGLNRIWCSRSRELLEERGPGSIGFYTSGQLFLEEYYTLAVLARAGIGTSHLVSTMVRNTSPGS